MTAAATRFTLALALAAGPLGCSSVSDFEGLWSATASTADDSCSGHFSSTDPQFTMRLRAGDKSDLEYVTLDSMDLTHELCVQTYSVDGDTATMEGTQTCSIAATGTDAEGNIVPTTVVQTYTQDRLKLDSDVLHEDGHLSYGDQNNRCSSAFTLSFVRLKN
jgi:hypothetical protein